MAIPVSNEGTFKKELIEAGTYFARCFQIIDLGTQHGEWQGKEIVSRKIILGFELPSEMRTFKDKEGNEISAPVVLSKEFTLSLGEKSKLLPFLQSWRGKDFTPEELKRFDVSSLLSKPCMVGVQIGTSKKGTEFNEITGITRVMKGFTEIGAQLEAFEFSMFTEKGQALIDVFDVSKFDKLPEFIQEKIKQSDEYKTLNWVDSEPKTTSQYPADELPF